MKILIFSDSHGDNRGILWAVSKNRDAELVLFLGDGARGAMNVLKELPSTVACVVVHGNCDGPFLGGIRDEEVLDLMGHRILFCHGHRYGVKGGLGGLISSAERQNCDIALFGHTHERYEEYVPEKKLYLFNPGSISEPARGERSFGILTLTERDVLFSHGDYLGD